MSISGIIHNRVLSSAIIAWAVAQVLKVIIVALTSKRFDYTRLVGSGGMPSSHSAFVMALTTKTGIMEGFSSTNFAIALCFALVVMYDAAGVRRAAGIQARILNNIMNDLSQNKPLQEKKLKELLGHTPIEVFAGAMLGIAIGIIV